MVQNHLFPPTWSEVGQEWHHRGVFLHLRCGEKMWATLRKNTATVVGIPSKYGATTVYRIDFELFIVIWGALRFLRSKKWINGWFTIS